MISLISPLRLDILCLKYIWIFPRRDDALIKDVSWVIAFFVWLLILPEIFWEITILLQATWPEVSCLNYEILMLDRDCSLCMKLHQGRCSCIVPWKSRSVIGSWNIEIILFICLKALRKLEFRIVIVGVLLRDHIFFKTFIVFEACLRWSLIYIMMANWWVLLFTSRVYDHLIIFDGSIAWAILEGIIEVGLRNTETFNSFKSISFGYFFDWIQALCKRNRFVSSNILLSITLNERYLNLFIMNT